MMAFWERLSASCAFLLFLLFLRRRFRRRPLPSFSGQRVLLTGAGSGLGAALATLLNGLGAELVLCGRNLERLRATAASLPNKDLAVRCLQLDLNKPEEIEEILRGLTNEIDGHVHCLINNAGQSYRGRISDTVLSVHEQLMRVDYMGHVAVTTAWMKHLRPPASDRNPGRVVFVSSVQGRLSIPYRSAYSAPKHALQAFADCLRAEEPSLQVLCLAPGYIRTNLSHSAVRDSGDVHGTMDATTARGLSPEAAADALLRALEAREGELTLAPITHRLAIVLRALCPSLCFKLMAKRAAGSKPY